MNENGELWVFGENELSDDFDVNWCFDFMFVMFLIAFTSLLTGKQVLGTNLGSRGSKTGFWCENWRVYREENPRTGVPVVV